MTQLWDENNRVVPVTVIEAASNVVTQVRAADTDGYAAVQLGFGEVKAVEGDQAAWRVTSRRPVSRRAATWPRSARPTPPSYSLGQELGADVFAAGETIDVTGTSKGKGFAGVMKRHGFPGVSASHGAHRNHRKPGSIGGCATPGRVFKGMRMAGRMGVDTITTQNLTVHSVDAEKGLILIKGAVPGPRGTVVVVRTAAKAKGADQ